jgi:hypothetical protein
MDARGTPAAAGGNAGWKRIGIAFLAVLGIGAITLGVVGVLVVKKRYPWVFELGRASQEMMKRSARSPATAELNRTLCSEAMVMQAEDVTRLQDLMKQKQAPRIPPDFRWMVSCHVRDASKAPGCDRVARTFRTVVPDSGKFVVVVTSGLFRGSGKPVCAVAYGADGRPLHGGHQGPAADDQDDGDDDQD